MDIAQSRVFVKLKKNILDPQGTAIKRELESLGYSGIADVRLGKMFEVSFDPSVNADKKQKMLREISEKLFVNPVTEDFEIE